MTFWSLLSRLLPVLMLLFTATNGQYRGGDVRLVGGSYQWEGRVEVYMSGVWGTITDSDWTDDDARVVCRKLGHFRAGATAYSNAYFGEGDGPVNLDSVQCSGSEYNLTECEIGNSGTRTTHSLDVGVKCQPADGSYRDGDLRLVGGPHNWEGRVEIYWNREWGAISDPQWSLSDANVVCRQLKHSQKNGAVISCCNNYGVGTGSIIMINVGCAGSETRINSCTHKMNSGSVVSHQNDVHVQCQEGNDIKYGDIRLVEGSNLWEGRVEIFLSGEWGTIHGYGSDSADAQVVCRQLGYETQGVSYTTCCSTFEEGTGRIHFRYPQCGGSEYRLSDCARQEVPQSDYTHSSDWGVICPIDGPDPWDIQLSSGISGQLQIYLSQQWKPVAYSYSNWIYHNSIVVCKELGYTSGGSLSTTGSYSGPTTYTIDNITCTGMEAQVKDCFHIPKLSSSYTTVAINCQNNNCNDGDMRLVNGTTVAEGRVELCYNNRWGTVCDNRWTKNSTAVACRHLGFSEIADQNNSSKKFGKGAGPVQIDYINCTGLEGSLWRWCHHFSHPSGCSHDDDVGVQCHPAQCSDGQLRLTDRPEQRYGRVEICSGRRWKTFYSSHWFPTNARVACIELGFWTYGSWLSSYGTGRGPRHSKYFKCSGSELRLSECESFNETASRTAGYDVAISCSTVRCFDGDMRLIEGKTEWEGRLEVCLGRRWGTVGGNEWTQTNSHVVCNALGYDITDEPANQSTPMALSKPLHYHSIRCSRRDLTLLECGFTRSSPYDYVEIETRTIVKCQQPVCEDGDLRLVGGNSGEGRLEVCFDKRWGTIDGNRWTHTDTQVACRQLGYSTSDVSYTESQRWRYHVSQSLPAFMTKVGCYGSEERLVDCNHQKIQYSTSMYNSRTTMDISISCSKTETPAKPSGVAIAALSLSAFLLVILVAFIYFQQRKKKKERSLSRHTHGSASSKYSPHAVSQKNTVTVDKKTVAKPTVEDGYEEMKPVSKEMKTTRQVGSSKPTTGSKPGARPRTKSNTQSGDKDKQESSAAGPVYEILD